MSSSKKVSLLRCPRPPLALPLLCVAVALSGHPHRAQAESNLGGDLNMIGQMHGGVNAPLYLDGSSSGTHNGVESLTSLRENSHSVVAGLNLGYRPDKHDEFWIRPEAVSGIPFSNATGLAGFPNIDMQKFMTVSPTVYLAQVFYRHTLDLGGAVDPVAGDGMQFGGEVTHQHLNVQVGKMDLLTLFDDNRWGHKSADRFLNWCFMTSCAYDFAADARGYASGLFAEYQWGDWSVRGGRFTLPKLPNQLPLDYQLFQHYGDNLELERRFEAGSVKLLGFHNHMKLATYGAVNGVLAPIPTAADNNNPNLPNPRVERDKYGVGLNGDYSPYPHLGVFGRLMVTSANTETAAFTDADHALALGVVGEGDLWNRPFDNAGLALAINAAGGQRRRYMEAWLPSLLVGDGQQAAGADYYRGRWFGPTPGAAFHYGREVVLET